jgi:putative ABC transport system permease protein
MLRHYLVTALRNIQRDPGHSAIAIGGLAMSLAAALMIGLYVRDEVSFDRWMPGSSSVYRIALGLEFGNFHEPPSAGTAAPVAGWMKADYPQVEAAGRIYGQIRTLRLGAVTTKDTIYWADSEIFPVLPFPTLNGDAARALENPDGMVLTRRMARKYFGTDDPIGQILEIDDTPFRVGAILKDLPAQTHFTTEVFVSGKSALSPLPDPAVPLKLNASFEELTRPLTYIRLKKGADPVALERDLAQFMARHVNVPKGPSGKPLFPLPTILMQPLPKIHFVPSGVNAMKASGSISHLYAMSAVGVLIILIGCFNYINIITAIAARRAVEVGIRKAMGARRHDLMIQFVGESVLMVAISGAIAVAMTTLLLPAMNALLSRSIAFEWWHEPGLAIFLVLVTAILGLLGGAYPAFVLSSFRTAAVLRGGIIRPEGRTLVRELLVCLQFAVLVGLVIATAVIYRQTMYAVNDSLRFERDYVLAVDTDCTNALPEQVRALPGVRATACSDALFGVGGGIGSTSTQPDGSRPTVSTFVAADWGLLELYGVKPLVGRLFLPDHPGDAMSARRDGDPWVGAGGSVVINQTAAAALGFQSPEKAIGKTAAIQGTADHPATIIGVVPDFELQGIRHQIQPTFFSVIPGRYKYLLVKLDGRQIPESLAAIDNLWRRFGTGDPIVRRFLNDEIQALYIDIRQESWVFIVFAVIAVLLAALGMLSLAAFTAERRTREIGIRKALGASRNDILQLLLWQLCRPVIWANLLAWPVAGFLMHRWLNGFYYHISVEWWLYVGAGAIAALLALMTASASSFTVARARPFLALRRD